MGQCRQSQWSKVREKKCLWHVWAHLHFQPLCSLHLDLISSLILSFALWDSAVSYSHWSITVRNFIRNLCQTCAVVPKVMCFLKLLCQMCQAGIGWLCNHLVPLFYLTEGLHDNLQHIKNNSQAFIFSQSWCPGWLEMKIWAVTCSSTNDVIDFIYDMYKDYRSFNQDWYNYTSETFTKTWP